MEDALMNLYTLRDARTYLVSKVFVISRLWDKKREINFLSFLIILIALFEKENTVTSEKCEKMFIPLLILAIV